MSMRSDLRAVLVAGVPLVNGRVYEPFFPNATTPKPYLVLKKGVVNPEDAWAEFSDVWEVWAYVDTNARFDALDAIIAQIEATLGDAQLAIVIPASNGDVYKAEWLGCTDEDGIDTELKAKFRYAAYRLFNLGWLVDVDPDPSPARALRDWTLHTWPDLQHDPLSWVPSSPRPGLYWRTRGYHMVERLSWGGWVDALIHGHVVAPGIQVRREWTKRLCEAIIRQRHLILPDRSPLYFGQLDGDSEADPMRVGQIVMTARYSVEIERPVGPVLERVTVTGSTGWPREIVHLVESDSGEMTDAEVLGVFGQESAALAESATQS